MASNPEEEELHRFHPTFAAWFKTIEYKKVVQTLRRVHTD